MHGDFRSGRDLWFSAVCTFGGGLMLDVAPLDPAWLLTFGLVITAFLLLAVGTFLAIDPLRDWLERNWPRKDGSEL